MRMKEGFNESIQSILIALLFLLTQYTISIPNPFSIGDAANVNLGTIALLCLAVWCVCYQIILRRQYTKLSSSGKFVFVLAVVFCIMYAMVTVLRFVFQNRLTISVSMTLTLLLGITAFLLADLGYVTKRAILKGAFLFINCMNFYALCLLFLNHGTVRSSNMIDFMGNINVYIAVAFSTAPFLVDYCFKNRAKKRIKYQFWGNVIVFSMMLCLSGSRVGIYIYWVELVAMYFILYRFTVQRAILLRGATAILVTLMLVVGSCISNEDVQIDVQRTFYLPTKVITILAPEFKKPNQSQEVPTEAVEEDTLLTPDSTELQKPIDSKFELSDPDNDIAPMNGVTQSYTRSWALERAKNVLSKYWIFGTGRDAIAMWGWGYQSSHNIIIDAILCYGVFGAAIYMLVWLLPVGYIWLRSGERSQLCLYLVAYAAIMAYSMIQPILSNKLLIVLFLWFGIALHLPQESKRND